MATPALVNTLLEQGQAIVRTLDGNGVKVTTAFWAYDEDAADWRLVLATPLVEHEGGLKAYEYVQRILYRTGRGFDQVRLRQIMLVGPRDSKIQTLRHAVPKRRALNEWNGPDVYVYRST